MTAAKAIRFPNFTVKIGDGATPEVFVAPCAFTSRSFVRNKTLQETIIPDCADEEKAGWIYRDPLSVSWGVSGEGIMDEGSIETWDAWFIDADPRNLKITIDKSDVSTIVYTGLAHLQTLTYTGTKGERVTFTVDIVSTGPLTETPAPLVLGSSLMDGAEETDAVVRAERQTRTRKSDKAEKAAA